RVYGTRLYFTRAADFGFTKTADEALKVWGDEVLEDMVRVIRTFRPHVIINSWGGVHSGHGQHQASGILTPKAYAMAADPNAFPEQIKEGLQAWKAESLLQISRGDASGGFAIPVSEISPLWGKSWGEIGIEGYLNHRTQGVGGIRSSPFFRRAISLVAVEGEQASKELLARKFAALSQKYVQPGWEDRAPSYEGSLVRLVEEVDPLLEKARQAALALDWQECSNALLEALGRIFGERWRSVKRFGGEIPKGAAWDLYWAEDNIRAALAKAAGVRVDARAERSEVAAGESFVVRVEAGCRSGVKWEVKEVDLLAPDGWDVKKVEGAAAGQWQFSVLARNGADASQKAAKWILAEEGALLWARANVWVGDGDFFSVYAPVVATRMTSVSAETRPLLLVPAVTLTVEPKEMVVISGGNRKSEIRNQKQTEREIVVRVRHYATTGEKITVGIEAPQGSGEWRVASGENGKNKVAAQTADASTARTEQMLEFAGAGDQLVRFTVRASARIAAGKYELKAYAKRADGEEFRTSLEPLVTLPTRMWSEPAVARVHVMDVAVPKDLRVGYVAAENDLIPQALREIGVHVELLDEAALAFGDLSKYDAIAIGIRAYELRS
ncbi:MAG: hypothetical protein HY233_06735, partial [Acidobacteriales bacterium]|nr:hypothetical protein [Terriglobales bacterium]